MAPKTMHLKHVPGQRDLFGRSVAPDSPLPVALLTAAEAVVAKAQAAVWAGKDNGGGGGRGEGSGKGNRGGEAIAKASKAAAKASNRGGVAKAHSFCTVAPVPIGGGEGNWGPCILSGLVWQLRLDVSRLRLPYQPKTTCTHVPNPGSATEKADAAAVDDGTMMEAELAAMLDADEGGAAAAAAKPMENSEEVVDVDEARAEWQQESNGCNMTPLQYNGGVSGRQPLRQLAPHCIEAASYCSRCSS